MAIAAVVVGAVILLTRRGGGDHNESQPSSSTQDDLAAAPGTTTCQAWQKARAKMDDAPALPDGWDWNTPDIDTLIGERAKVINQALDEFDPQIKNEEPLMVAVFAHIFVKDKRTEMRRLTTHAWSPMDSLHANIDQQGLDKACNGEG